MRKESVWTDQQSSILATGGRGNKAGGVNDG